jgi:hypothetical protein
MTKETSCCSENHSRRPFYVRAGKQLFLKTPVGKWSARRQRGRRAESGAPIFLKRNLQGVRSNIYKKKLLQIQGWYFFYFVVLWMYHLRKEKSDENRNT